MLIVNAAVQLVLKQRTKWSFIAIHNYIGSRVRHRFGVGCRRTRGIFFVFLVRVLLPCFLPPVFVCTAGLAVAFWALFELPVSFLICLTALSFSSIFFVWQLEVNSYREGEGLPRRVLQNCGRSWRSRTLLPNLFW